MLMSAHVPLRELENAAEFVARHVGIDAAAERHMLSVIGAASRRALIEAVVPRSIARAAPMRLPDPLPEAQALAEARAWTRLEAAQELVQRHGYQVIQPRCVALVATALDAYVRSRFPQLQIPRPRDPA